MSFLSKIGDEFWRKWRLLWFFFWIGRKWFGLIKQKFRVLNDLKLLSNLLAPSPSLSVSRTESNCDSSILIYTDHTGGSWSPQPLLRLFSKAESIISEGGNTRHCCIFRFRMNAFFYVIVNLSGPTSHHFHSIFNELGLWV